MRILTKNLMMGAYGIFMLGKASSSIVASTAPEPATMGIIGFVALIGNGTVALLL